MVNGLKKFQEFFKDHTDSFVILGGAACAEWFAQTKFIFRATKDIDMVIILEARNQEFFARLWEYLRQGGYESWLRADGSKTFFRFVNPSDESFPLMIELLAHPDIVAEPPESQTVFPIHIDEKISSLSAILLDEDYYRLILANKELSNSGLPLVNPATLLLLKVKAYLNLLADKNAGKFIQGGDLKKHRNDVFRLSYLLEATETMNIPAKIHTDLSNFLELFPENSDEWPGIISALGSSRLDSLSPQEIIALIRRFYRQA